MLVCSRFYALWPVNAPQCKSPLKKAHARPKDLIPPWKLKSGCKWGLCDRCPEGFYHFGDDLRESGPIWLLAKWTILSNACRIEIATFYKFTGALWISQERVRIAYVCLVLYNMYYSEGGVVCTVVFVQIILLKPTSGYAIETPRTPDHTTQGRTILSVVRATFLLWIEIRLKSS